MEIDKIALFARMGYSQAVNGIQYPHPKVMDFHLSKARFKIACCPRQSSKSYSTAKGEVIPDLLIPGHKWWLVGPEYSLIKEFDYVVDELVHKEGRRRLDLPPPTLFRNNPKGGDMRIVFPWGSEVACKSCEKPSSLQGEALDGVVLSETGRITDSRIWHRYLRSTLSVRKGKAIFPTTPNVEALWLRELYEKSLTNADADWASFNWPVTANPLFPREEFEKAKETYGENHPIFREQWLGEWVFYTGRVYPEFQRETHVIEPFEIPKDWRRIRAIDFGHRDPFVGLWLAVGPDSELYLYTEYHQAGNPTVTHVHNIKAIEKGQHVTLSLADPSAKQLIADLRVLGLPCSGAITDRKAGRERVGEYLTLQDYRPQSGVRIPACDEQGKYPKLFVFSTCVNTIHELLFYRWAEGQDKEGLKEKTEGADHCCDALRYAVMARPSPLREPAVTPKYSAAWFAKRERQKQDNRMLLGGH